MTEMEKLKAGLPYSYDDPELVEMKDTASALRAKLNAVDPLDALAREAAACHHNSSLERSAQGIGFLHGFVVLCHSRRSATTA